MGSDSQLFGDDIDPVIMFHNSPTEILRDEKTGDEILRWTYNLNRLFKPGQTRTDNGVRYVVVSTTPDYSNGLITTYVRKS